MTTDVSDVGIPGYALRVVHDYHPSRVSPNLYEVTVSITNTGTQPVTDLRYRRVMDWDIEPSAFTEWVTIANTAASRQLLFDSDQGFSPSNPLGARGYRQSQTACGTAYTGTCNFTDLGTGGQYPTVTRAADHGALFDFGFGALAVGATRVFQTYYGAAPSEATALSAFLRSTTPTAACSAALLIAMLKRTWPPPESFSPLLLPSIVVPSRSMSLALVWHGVAQDFGSAPRAVRKPIVRAPG